MQAMVNHELSSFVLTSYPSHGVIHVRPGKKSSCPGPQLRFKRGCLSTNRSRIRFAVRASTSDESSDADRSQADKEDENIDWDSSWQTYKGEADGTSSVGKDSDRSPGQGSGLGADMSNDKMSAGNAQDGNPQDSRDSGGVFRISTEESPVKELLDDRTNRLTDAWTNQAGFLAGIGVVFLVGCFYVYAWTHQMNR